MRICSSGIDLSQLFERMGIAAQLRPTAVLVPGGRPGDAEAARQWLAAQAGPLVRAQLPAQGMEAP